MLSRVRFTIAGMMILVCAVAIGLAASTAGSFTLSAVVLAEATLGALIGRGSARVFLLGFASAGWAYLLLAFGLGYELRDRLPTNWIIPHLYQSLYGPLPTPSSRLSTIDIPWNQFYHWTLAAHASAALVFALIGGLAAWLITPRAGATRGERKRR